MTSKFRRCFLGWVCLALPAQAKFLTFPENFQWCVATSAHQIEGNNETSDWWAWEQRPGVIRNGDRSGLATDHWNHLEEDVGLMKELGVGTYRFSVEWAKIEPRDGEWSEAALDNYRRLLKRLRENGIRPLITLHHFTLPDWVAARGAWEWSELPERFDRYTRHVYRALADVADVPRDWVTINEPMILLTMGYLKGVFPPGEQRPMSALGPVLEGMLRTHARAYRALHEEAEVRGVPLRAGFAHHLRIFDPARKMNLFDRRVAKELDQIFNWALIDAVERGELKLSPPDGVEFRVSIDGLRGSQDFLGLNYYSRDVVRYDSHSPTRFVSEIPRGSAVTDLGWEIYPEGFFRILQDLHNRVPTKPIIVTENGLADLRDSQRAAFMEGHLAQLHRALKQGIPVEGYCHWSLLDNFEWAEGFAPRFGLYEVNYSTFERTARPSARRYRSIILDNGLEDPGKNIFRKTNTSSLLEHGGRFAW